MKKEKIENWIETFSLSIRKNHEYINEWRKTKNNGAMYTTYGK